MSKKRPQLDDAADSWFHLEEDEEEPTTVEDDEEEDSEESEAH